MIAMRGSARENPLRSVDPSSFLPYTPTMTEKNIQHIIEYWEKTAARDIETTQALLKTKRYAEALFFGHLALEKILKALVVKETKTHAPYIHDLVRLQALAKLDLPRTTVHILNVVNDFNIRARYPEYKLQFYKRCTRPYTLKYLAHIHAIYRDLCNDHRQKQ